LKEVDENGDGLLSKREMFLFIMKQINRYDDAKLEIEEAGLG